MKKERRANEEIYDSLSKRNMYIWQLADLIGVSESSMYRFLRKELPEEKKKEWLDLIDKGETNYGN